MPCILGSTAPVEVKSGVKKFRIGIIADLDKLAKGTDEKGQPVWRSKISTGSLTYDFTKKSACVEIHSGDEAVPIQSGYSRGTRGMELSEFIKFGGNFYTVCDKTGIVYRISDTKTIPWVLLVTGDGNQEAGFKGEWMTRKDGKLLVGSHGTEIYLADGKVDKNKKWIKEIDLNGAVKHIDWNDKFDAMKNALGCPSPGYLTHESCVWSEVHKHWFLLPRKISKEVFDDKADETRCGNVLLKCDENFTKIEKTTIGTLRPSRGYASFKFLPGTNDSVIVAIKSEEIGDAQQTFFTVFGIDGTVILDDVHIADAKYEGLEFLDE